MLEKGIAGVLFLLMLVGIFSCEAALRYRARRALKHAGRQIAWSEAIQWLQNGHGFLVENFTSLPGRLWWLKTVNDSEHDDLFDLVDQHGLLVAAPPQDVQQQLAALGLTHHLIRLDAEPFVD